MALIVAEIGQNWCGDHLLAFKLIDEAKWGGADFVKFQLYDSQKLYGEHQPTELTQEMARVFFQYGELQGIEVFFSVFDVERVKWCEEMGVKRYKIAYSQRDNYNLYSAIPWDKPIYASGDKENLPLMTPKTQALYCVPEYPAPLKHLNLEMNFKGFFTGFSDHTIGLDASKIALARGARIIEKHFAVDHKTGVDAEWSMTPSELKELVRFEKVCREVL